MKAIHQMNPETLSERVTSNALLMADRPDPCCGREYVCWLSKEKWLFVSRWTCPHTGDVYYKIQNAADATDELIVAPRIFREFFRPVQ